MIEPPSPGRVEPTREQPAAKAYARLAPYEKSFGGTAPDGSGANGVTVTAARTPALRRRRGWSGPRARGVRPISGLVTRPAACRRWAPTARRPPPARRRV